MHKKMNIFAMIDHHTTIYPSVNYTIDDRINITSTAIQHIIQLAGTAASNQNVMQAFEIGKIILNISQQLMSLIINNGVESSIDFVVMYKIKNLSLWKIFLSMFFHLLVDLNKTDLAIQFKERHKQFSSIIQSIIDAKDLHADDAEMVECLFDFLIDQPLPFHTHPWDTYCDSQDPEYRHRLQSASLSNMNGDGTVKQDVFNMAVGCLSLLSAPERIKLHNITFDMGFKYYPLLHFESSRSRDLEIHAKYHQSVNEEHIHRQHITNYTTCTQKERFFRSFDELFSEMQRSIEVYHMQKWQDNVESSMKFFSAFLFYSMFLCDIKSNKACKYFEYCLQLRPLNGYLHYLYSLYLLNVVKNYKLSYFHLKMAHKLNPNLSKLNLNAAKTENDVFTNHQIDDSDTVFQALMKILCIKLNKQHKCDYNNCNKILKTLNACKGCRCVYYCSKKCQKKDWKQHKINCVSTYTTQFDKNQMQSFHHIDYFLQRSVQNLLLVPSE